MRARPPPANTGSSACPTTASPSTSIRAAPQGRVSRSRLPAKRASGGLGQIAAGSGKATTGACERLGHREERDGRHVPARLRAGAGRAVAGRLRFGHDRDHEIRRRSSGAITAPDRDQAGPRHFPGAGRRHAGFAARRPRADRGGEVFPVSGHGTRAGRDAPPIRSGTRWPAAAFRRLPFGQGCGQARAEGSPASRRPLCLNAGRRVDAVRAGAIDRPSRTPRAALAYREASRRAFVAGRGSCLRHACRNSFLTHRV